MSAREQMAIAAAKYRDADRQIYSLGFAKCGREWRMECYRRWIAAVILFRRVQEVRSEQ